MKKTLLILVLALAFVFGSSGVFSDVCNEFQLAKQTAQISKPDLDRNQVIGNRVAETLYLVGYFPKIKMISGSVSRAGKMSIVVYDIDVDKYTYVLIEIYTGAVLETRGIAPGEACEIMSNILKHLVNNGPAI